MKYTALEKYKQLLEERKQKEKEKKKAKKEKEKEKKKKATYERILKKKREAYKPIHIKNLRKRQNARAYKKIRAKRLAEHAANNDVYGYYRIILTKNMKMYDELSRSWWQNTAYEKYEKYIQDNLRDVVVPKTITLTSDAKPKPIVYEILLIKKIDPQKDNRIREFRNKMGKFVENYIENNENYAIIDKHEWRIPETYNVYGFNPITDRKTAKWIGENKISQPKEKIVFVCDNKLIIQYDNDIDFVICKTPEECVSLYNEISSRFSNTPSNFCGMIASKERKSIIYNKLEEKTGWNRKVLYKTKL